jgi:hypothetical protein
MMSDYDSTADTLTHSRRVGQLIGEVVTELINRMTGHDLSKTQPPEKAIFDEFTPKLATTVYGTAEYKAQLAAMGEALRHHYDHNRHHPEHFSDGVSGMSLVDLVEMLADWKAATERSKSGDIDTSLPVQRKRFGIAPQLLRVLRNTVVDLDWSDLPEGVLPATDADLEQAQRDLTREVDSLARRLEVRFAETEAMRGALFTADEIFAQFSDADPRTMADPTVSEMRLGRALEAAAAWREQHRPKLATTETLKITVEDDDDPDGTPVEGAYWSKESSG